MFRSECTARSSAFQSTHPLRGATAVVSCFITDTGFQSTHPLRGATEREERLNALRAISIHAPLAGCDPVLSDLRRRQFDFNPRTPCGVRLKKEEDAAAYEAFQSTHPLRGATSFSWSLSCSHLISIHAPLAGCDVEHTYYRTDEYTFQSTHPLRGATTFDCATPMLCAFQSTHPLRGATDFVTAEDVLPIISIHAPLAGCDP